LHLIAQRHCAEVPPHFQEIFDFISHLPLYF
jgi:hypothetical protein